MKTPGWRDAFWCSVAGLALAPVAAYVWMSGDIGGPVEWWRWVLTTLALAPTFMSLAVARRAVGREDLFSSADRKVWSGWLRMGGPLATPFVLRAAQRAERHRSPTEGSDPLRSLRS